MRTHRGMRVLVRSSDKEYFLRTWRTHSGMRVLLNAFHAILLLYCFRFMTYIMIMRVLVRGSDKGKENGQNKPPKLYSESPSDARRVKLGKFILSVLFPLVTAAPEP